MQDKEVLKLVGARIRVLRKEKASHKKLLGKKVAFILHTLDRSNVEKRMFL